MCSVGTPASSAPRDPPTTARRPLAGSGPGPESIRRSPPLPPHGRRGTGRGPRAFSTSRPGLRRCRTSSPERPWRGRDAPASPPSCGDAPPSTPCARHHRSASLRLRSPRSGIAPGPAHARGPSGRHRDGADPRGRCHRRSTPGHSDRVRRGLHRPGSRRPCPRPPDSFSATCGHADRRLPPSPRDGPPRCRQPPGSRRDRPDSWPPWGPPESPRSRCHLRRTALPRPPPRRRGRLRPVSPCHRSAAGLHRATGSSRRRSPR